MKTPTTKKQQKDPYPHFYRHVSVDIVYRVDGPQGHPHYGEMPKGRVIPSVSRRVNLYMRRITRAQAKRLNRPHSAALFKTRPNRKKK